jgi:hypothetical protein
MKKNLFFALSLVMGFILLAGCLSLSTTKTVEQPQEEGAKSGAGTSKSATGGVTRVADFTLTDWQGASFGRDIPAWVGLDKPTMIKDNQEFKDKEVYPYFGEGGDLDLLRASARVQAFDIISTQLEASVITGAGGFLEGQKGDSIETAKKNEAVKNIAAIVAKNCVSGFTIDREFWENRKYPDGTASVAYYAIYAMSAEALKRNMNRATGNLDPKTPEEREAIEAINSAIREAERLLP